MTPDRVLEGEQHALEELRAEIGVHPKGSAEHFNAGARFVLEKYREVFKRLADS